MKAWSVESFLSPTDAAAREPQTERGQAAAPTRRGALPAGIMIYVTSQTTS